MFPPLFVLYAKNDQFIEFGPMIDGTTDDLPTPTYLNGLTGTVTVKDITGTPVAGADALAFSYVAASNGVYRALISGSGFNPTAGRGYLAVIDFNLASSGAVGHWEIPVKVEIRRAS